MKKTFITTFQSPFGCFTRYGHRVLFPDGKIRAVKLAPVADTYFSIPAKAKINKKTYTGYVTVEEQHFIRGKKETNFLTAYVFRPHTDQGMESFPLDSEKMNYLISLAN